MIIRTLHRIVGSTAPQNVNQSLRTTLLVLGTFWTRAWGHIKKKATLNNVVIEIKAETLQPVCPLLVACGSEDRLERIKGETLHPICPPSFALRA